MGTDSLGQGDRAPADPPASEGVLKEEPIARLREMGQALGPEVPRRILELYLGDSPARLAAMRQALLRGDAREMERAAHALKGSSANLGASDLAELCHQLERLSGERVPAGTPERLDALEAEYARVEQAMRRLLTEFPDKLHPTSTLGAKQP